MHNSASYLLAFDWWICQIRNVIVCFPRTYTNELENKRDFTASQTFCYQQGDGCLLLIAPSKRLREKSLRSHRTWCWGGREGGKEVGREDWGGRKGGKGGKCERDFFFFTFDKSCSHMGGTRPCDLTKRLNREWSQWSIHQQTRSAWRRWRRGKIKMKRTSVCRTVKELIQAVSTECGAFLLWCVWVSTSAALLFYSVRCKRHKNIISSCY